MKKSNNFSKFETQLMRRLIKMAQTRHGYVAPNPIVAAAVVKDEKVISYGVHCAFGEAHAEVMALNVAAKKAQGAILYVTLSPCTHHGKTPPCVNAIIKSGVKTVVWAVDDENPTVKANSAATILQTAGISTKSGLCEKEARLANATFFKNQTKKLPYVILKAALSLDGRIALANGKSKYITSTASRRQVHRLRHQVDGILVGIKTILADDPQLNIRCAVKPRGKFAALASDWTACHPRPIILDSKLRTPAKARVFENQNLRPLIFTSDVALQNDQYKVLCPKAEIIAVPQTSNGLCWKSILQKLFELNIYSVLLEGGSAIFSSALDANIVDQVQLFYAPMLINESNSKPFLAGKPKENLADTIRLSNITCKKLSTDIWISASI